MTEPSLKKVALCDDYCFFITEADAEVLRRLSPGLFRLVKDCDAQSATHFVCEACGQLSPVKLRHLHKCSP